MGRATPTPRRRVLVETAVDEFWARPVARASPFALALLLGQRGTNEDDAIEDRVLVAVAVPPEEEGGDVEEEELSCDWVQEVACQVDRLLPGGLVVLGLSVRAAGDARTATERGAVYARAIAQRLALPPAFRQQAPGPTGAEDEDAMTIVHVDPTRPTKTATCLLGISHPRHPPTIVRAEIEAPVPWSSFALERFTMTIAIDELLAFSDLLGDAKDATPTAAAVKALAEKRLDEAYQQLAPLTARVWESTAVLSQRGDATARELELLTSAVTPSLTTHKATGHCRGEIKCLAFAPSKGPQALATASYFLKHDFVRSLLLRLDLLLERWGEDDHDDDDNHNDRRHLRAFDDGHGRVGLPRRGLLPWTTGATGANEHLALSLHVPQGDDATLAAQGALDILLSVDVVPPVTTGHATPAVVWLESDAASDPGDRAAAHVAPKGQPPSPVLPPSTPAAANDALRLRDVLFIVLPVLFVILAGIIPDLMELWED